MDDAGRLHLHKRLTTPDDPARSVGEGVRELSLPADAQVVHGSTIATNALLERRGARTALITTQGFADVLEIGRQNRPDLYALVPRKPPPLVPRAWRFELSERVAADGSILIPLDPQAVAALIPRLQAEGIESVAVCFLFSFLRPEHEQLVKQMLEAGNWRLEGPPPPSRPEGVYPPPSTLHSPPSTRSVQSLISISLSSEILPEYREYERVSTTVVNAYVAPLMDHYLARLEKELSPRPLRIMQSNGGCLTAATARAHAARTALSGPAGGVVGAMAIAAQHAGLEKELREHAGTPGTPSSSFSSLSSLSSIITFDMGGTSTDVCLCPGYIPLTAESEISGAPLRLPIIDIHTVGAGGGSLARVDAGGALTVGPESAGADPDPACYGHGGRLVTVTDANLVLNRLDPAHFLGGKMTLDRAAAEAAFAELGRHAQRPSAIGYRPSAIGHPPSATRSGQLPALAWGVLQVANATMERAIRKISVERGYDPRDFTLVAFGGAGPLHACELAERLAIPRVLVPRAPGVLSALGMLLADLVKDYSLTVMRPAQAVTEADLRELFAPLEARARAEMAADYAPQSRAEWEVVAVTRLDYSLDARYVGQSFEINVPLREEGQWGLVVGDFHARHAQRYGHSRPAQPVEFVNLRLRAIAPTPKPVFEELAGGGQDASPAQVGVQDVWFETPPGLAPQAARLYQREKLLAGHRITGPAVIFQFDATTLIPPDWQGQVDHLGHLLLTRHNI